VTVERNGTRHHLPYDAGLTRRVACRKCSAGTRCQTPCRPSWFTRGSVGFDGAYPIASRESRAATSASSG
jgi:hypothetical protein